MRENRKKPTFRAGMPVPNATVFAITLFDGFRTTVVVHPKAKKIILPGQRWLVDIDRRAVSLDRKKMEAVAYSWPIRQLDRRPIASAKNGRVFIRPDFRSALRAQQA